MAASNYLGSRAEAQQREQARREEQRQIELVPEGEREEIRQIYAAKGFHGDDLERAVAIITSDRDVWLETMMREELGYGSDVTNPLRAAASTLSRSSPWGSCRSARSSTTSPSRATSRTRSRGASS